MNLRTALFLGMVAFFATFGLRAQVGVSSVDCVSVSGEGVSDLHLSFSDQVQSPLLESSSGCESLSSYSFVRSSVVVGSVHSLLSFQREDEVSSLSSSIEAVRFELSSSDFYSPVSLSSSWLKGYWIAQGHSAIKAKEEQRQHKRGASLKFA